LSIGVDMVALSFVRSAADADLVHAVMDRVGRRVPVIAKLEKPEAVDNLEAIVLAFDAVMVARGDLGVELPLEEVPLVQKHAIQIARENAKPVIVATQMLESMIENSRPTRAEASDVANAILDGADAVMLSGETSVGKFPLEAVRTMARIISRVEQDSTGGPLAHVPRTKRGVISYAARDIGERLDAKALVAFTSSGETVRRLARLHSRLPLLAFVTEPELRNRLALVWGTETYIVPEADSTDSMIRQVDHALLELGRYQRGDLVIIVAGAPPGTVGSTNLIHVHRIGEDDH
jgi:pyruvate kinase